MTSRHSGRKNHEKLVSKKVYVKLSVEASSMNGFTFALSAYMEISPLFRFQSPFTDAYPRVAQQQYEHHVQVPVSESIQITANYPMHFPHHQHNQKIDVSPAYCSLCSVFEYYPLQYPQSAALSLPPSMGQPPPQTALPTAPLPRPSTVSPCEQTALSSPTLTSNSGSAASETPPISGEVISTDLEVSSFSAVLFVAGASVVVATLELNLIKLLHFYSLYALGKPVKLAVNTMFLPLQNDVR